MEKIFYSILIFYVVSSIHGLKKDSFDGIPHIEHLTKENFEKKVLKSEKVWLVEFYDAKNEKSKESIPELEKTARILAGIAKIGVVDASKEDSLAHNYDAKETPSILLFGLDKEKPTLYKDELKAQNLIKKVGSQVKVMVRSKEEKAPNPKKDVIKLTAENFQKKVLDSDGIWLVKYYDPNCGHSKAFAPDYAKAAGSLKGAVHVGAVNMDVEPYAQMGEPYNIEKVPWVKIFGVDKTNPIDYTGPRKATELIDRALEEMEKLVRKRLESEKQDDLYPDNDDDDEDQSEEKKEIKAKKDEKITEPKKDKESEKEREKREIHEEKEKGKAKEVEKEEKWECPHKKKAQAHADSEKQEVKKDHHDHGHEHHDHDHQHEEKKVKKEEKEDHKKDKDHKKKEKSEKEKKESKKDKKKDTDLKDEL